MLHLLDVPPRDNQGDDLGIRPDSRKRVRAAEAADDGGIPVSYTHLYAGGLIDGF